MSSFRIGAGLYSVRDELKKDLPATLEKLKQFGYQGVEFFGAWELPAAELAAAVDGAGLNVCGWHVPFASLADENIDKTIEYHQRIGNKYLIVPGGVGGKSRAAWLEAAERFNGIARRLPQGMFIGYHNHSKEFSLLDGERPWDTFAQNTLPQVVLQLDTGNALSGGADPLALLERYPGRARTIHLKPYAKATEFDAFVGQDDQDWPGMLAHCREMGNDWLIIEYEYEQRYDQLTGMQVCIDALKPLLG